MRINSLGRYTTLTYTCDACGEFALKPMEPSQSRIYVDGFIGQALMVFFSRQRERERDKIMLLLVQKFDHLTYASFMLRGNMMVIIMQFFFK